MSARADNRHRDESHSEDEHDVRALGGRRHRGGWQGDHLELQHSMDMRRSDTQHDDTVVAVDLSQFRNTEVGRGYQAKHVVRQKGLPEQEAVPRRHRTPTQRDLDEGEPRHDTNPTERRTRRKLETYLECERLRCFRKKLAEIEASTGP